MPGLLRTDQRARPLGGRVTSVSTRPTTAPSSRAGRPLRTIAPDLCARVAAQIAGERQQSDLFFASIKRLLDRDEPGWSRL